MVDYVFLPPDLPELKDMFWEELSQDIKDTIGYWKDSRQELERRWVECDQAYMCFRKLPRMENFEYITAGDFGSAEVHNAVNNFCIRLGIATMDKNDDWLTLVGRAGEPPEVTLAVRQEQLWMHRQSETRKLYTRGLKQMVVRGATDWWLEWKKKTHLRPVGTVKGRQAVVKFYKQTNGLDAAEARAMAKEVKMVREKVMSFNGPAPKVLDCFDVFRDPECSILQDEIPSSIIRRYIRPHELEKAQDPVTKEYLFDNLEGLRATTAGDVYYENKDNTRRMRTQRMMGMNSTQTGFSNISAEVVPVYVFYTPYKYYKGVEFFDTYFYVAMSDNNDPRIIRIEENPDPSGHHCLISENFIEHYTTQAYGIGAVQTVLPQLARQNFMEELLTCAVVANGFPSYLAQANVFKDDIVDLTPSSINEIMSGAGLDDVIKVMPTNPNGVMITFQDLDYNKSKIQGTFETSGAYGQQDNKDRETATSVNARTASQGLAIDEQSEKFGPALLKWCQWSYDYSQATKKPEQNAQGDPVVEYGARQSDGNYQGAEIFFGEWKQPRKVEIVGSHGITNRAQRITNLQSGMTGFGQMGQFLPNPGVVGMSLIKEYYKEMEIQMPPEAWLTPQELAAQDPEVQMMALQAGMENPQMIAMAMAKNAETSGDLPPGSADQMGGGAQGGPSGGSGQANTAG